MKNPLFRRTYERWVAPQRNRLRGQLMVTGVLLVGVLGGTILAAVKVEAITWGYLVILNLGLLALNLLVLVLGLLYALRQLSPVHEQRPLAGKP
jgi:hypothetical protein